MGAKYRQINEFLRIIEQVLGDRTPEQGPLYVVDAGCGSAYLTFAAYHYLNHVRGFVAHLDGVDVNKEVIGKGRQLRNELGWERMRFHRSTIASYEPEHPPDIVLSLHACDTATDEAIARGIRWQAGIILAAPCCQHELHHQIDVDIFRPVLRHGILRERLAEILTDALRASVLRIMGYRTSVYEFVSAEATAKNLMIQAEAGLPAGDTAMVDEYEQLKAYWDVRPVLEEMVGIALWQHLPRGKGQADEDVAPS
jgi:SAM-dependent methyltransferase